MLLAVNENQISLQRPIDPLKFLIVPRSPETDLKMKLVKPTFGGK